jgi:chitin synthase
LLFIVADGLVTGSGNGKSTPDICRDLLDLDDTFPTAAASYLAIATGSLQHNMAKVYCGHYVTDNHRVPAVLVVKCGTSDEQLTSKPGNRGKRDSQLILMNFYSRVMFDDRMTPLDYDLFTKIHHIAHVTPDAYEAVLMVDADTRVYPTSLRLLMNCLQNDTNIIGLCGETRIANKWGSWVTAIQVFEYYISHHLGKAFESVFGGVTCLPGCFCTYRLKAPKGNDWTPVLIDQQVIQEYSSNNVMTLHAKNLLLLGEDRFLTTLMLRQFPHRKIMFLPQAVCKTVVPDTFSVLLSQRRRWINSTIHNLFELVLVRDLCGIFCFSMQFVVLLELVGTLVLPAAICMTYYLIVSIATSPIAGFTSWLPLIMLLAILGLPALLILITTRKLMYLFWMAVYLLSLPVWNFVLPVYAYWHFDDFSWGQTRKVDSAHDTVHQEGLLDVVDVPLRRWQDYERDRLSSRTFTGHFYVPPQNYSEPISPLLSGIPLEYGEPTLMGSLDGP